MTDTVQHESAVETVPVACVAGDWIPADQHPLWQHRKPTNWDELLAEVPIAGGKEVQAAASAARRVHRSWQQRSASSRADFLRTWADALAEREGELVQLLVMEIGKPVTQARAEVQRALRLARTTAHLSSPEPSRRVCKNGVRVRRCPLGVVALVTPWNSPVSVPVGKIAPALFFGNGIVWKPALYAPRTAMAVMDTLLQSGLPLGLVNLVFGSAQTVEHMIAQPAVAAMSLTGSAETGRRVAAMCTQASKPLQAELGGNNAALVMSDCDLKSVSNSLALAAFGFAGQRCTATRRFIVERNIRSGFDDAVRNAISRLRVGDPADPATQVGPLISREARERIRLVVERAVHDGVRILCGGHIPYSLPDGCWFQPTLLDSMSPQVSIVQQESFGPVAVIQTAHDIEEAIRLCNGVPHGLMASLYSKNESIQQQFFQSVEAGILALNQEAFEIQPAAPFGGWKVSQIGAPEHGIWDREFYSRPQAVYGWDDGQQHGI